MKSFVAGQDVRIPCTVERGAVPGEVFLTLESVHGVLSGFVGADHVIKAGERAFVRGRVKAVTPDSVVVLTPASFFTAAAGTAAVSREWAAANIRIQGA